MTVGSPINTKMPMADGEYLLFTTDDERGKWHTFVRVANGLITGFGSSQKIGGIQTPANPPLEFRALASQLRLIERR